MEMKYVNNKIVFLPNRKNKTLMFAYLSLERGLGWYKKLLSLSLQDRRELNINIRNCVGTVLSLNGHSKYFCMYHAKHPENNKKEGSKVISTAPVCNKNLSCNHKKLTCHLFFFFLQLKRMERMARRLSRKSDDAEAGAFIGFDSSSDSEGSQDEVSENCIYIYYRE